MPAYVMNQEALVRNARILRQVADAAGCRVVMALKGFSSWPVFPVIRPYLDGCCASGIWEARLAREEFGKEVLSYAPAYSDEDLADLLEVSNHVDFNSLTQWNKFQPIVLGHPRFQNGTVKCGLRVNPRCSTGHTALYDPCAPGSRLGVTSDALHEFLANGESGLNGISGLHMHTLCEQGAEDLAVTLEALEKDFGDILSRPEITWLNLGGGHWITKSDYNRELLIELVRNVSSKYGVEVWLEPGEAAAIHTGVLRCRVLDVFESEGFRHAILDISASAHMPDVLEMPYRPDVFLVEQGGGRDNGCSEFSPAVRLTDESYQRAGDVGNQSVTYRLGAPTCLAGDVIGDYSFNRLLEVGDVLVFDDMSHYTMVKTSFFNGVCHPDIVLQREDGHLETLREFTYSDFRSRLG